MMDYTILDAAFVAYMEAATEYKALKTPYRKIIRRDAFDRYIAILVSVKATVLVA